ncbi:ATP-binding cassette subfamily B protein [Pedobacter sp. CG_S7]|uniref:peptidase domain-containing ABC transporter n=1 Tax=Pedobacter sp. CG_S7 TaxID=3143930 RepID=UPI0033924A0E
MAEKNSLKSTIKKLFQLVNLERFEIEKVYIYATLSGLIILSLPLGIQAIINLMFGSTISTSMVVLIALVIIGVLINGVLQIKQMRITERIQQRIFARLTFAYAYRIPKLSLPGIDEYYLPELVNRFFDTASLQKGLSKLLIDLPTASIQVLFGLIILSFYHPIFIVFGFFLLFLVIIIFFATSPKGFQTSIVESDYKYDVAHWLEEISRAIKTFKFYQQTDLHLKKTDKLLNGYLKAREDHFSILVFQYRIIIGFKVLITAGMLVIGAVLFVNQKINLGQFIAAEIIIITIINALEKLIVSLDVVYDVLTSLEKINKVLDKEQDSDADLLVPDNWEGKGMSIKIKNLNFFYNPKSKILKKINLEIKPGEKICIMGEEGSGKSTLLKLLSGMWPNFTGNLFFNDEHFKSILPEALYKHIAFYFSEDELFSGSLLENILVGTPNNNKEELKRVCELVGLSDFIAEKQDGFEMKLDTQGKKLSSNIAQKILLARCILRKPSLMLLEDGWLGLDNVDKQNIINYLTDLNQPFTMIAISNDEQFAARCSRVIKIENGHIIN